MENLIVHACAIIFLFCFTIPICCFESHLHQNEHHVALFVFGDSLSDPGNNNYITTTFRSNFWPYGESFFSYPTGRPSDGRLIPDFVAEYANLPLIPSYFEALHNSFNFGVNFASTGAGCLDETYPDKVINLKTQLKYFINVTKRLKEEFGSQNYKELVSNAVYLLNIGSNDYYNLYETNPALPKEYVDFVIGNLTSVIKQIYKEGGRKFGIINLGPLGCVPNMRALNIIRGGVSGQCMDEVTTIAKMHNLALSRGLQELEKHLKGFKYSKFNFFDQLTKRIQNPSTYGFKETKTACCGGGPYRGHLTCGNKLKRTKEYELCDNVEDYLFFDAYHPTQSANQQFAKLWWQGSPDVAGPRNMKYLFQLSSPYML